MSKFSRPFQLLSAICVAPLLTPSSAVLAADGPTMTIGSKAPAIDIEHWVSDGDGQFPHTTKLDSGKVYIVEFWATWCAPCIAAMPHLSETQQKYADQGVQLISVSREPLETVETFLEKPVRNDKDKTYRELTSTYSLTCDPDRSTFEDYFQAAGQTGIPCAFIVGKSGLIEWIGHPMRMEDPLEQVLADKWDREAFGVEFAAAQKKKWLQAELSRNFRTALNLANAGKSDEAIKIFDTLIANEEYEAQHGRLKQARAGILITTSGEDAESLMTQYIADHGDDASALAAISRDVLTAKLQRKELPDSVFALAAEAANKAVESNPDELGFLYLLAQWQKANGETEQAIKTTETAIELATKQNSRLAGMLTQFLATLKPKQETPAKESEPAEEK